MKKLLLIVLFCLYFNCYARSIRRTFTFESGWHAVCYPEDVVRYGDSIVANDVTLPHTFDAVTYQPTPSRGHLHGTAVYDFEFSLMSTDHPDDLFYRLRLDGAGTYVTVIVNEDTICNRLPAGPLTTMLDLNADSLYLEKNTLRIICYHPSKVDDMPWICSDCNSPWGGGAGHQPFGLFRGVSLEERYGLHIMPFGVHAWTNTACDTLFVDTEVRNMNKEIGNKIRLQTSVTAKLPMEGDSGRTMLYTLGIDNAKFKLLHGEKTVIHQAIPIDATGYHWAPERPFQYQIQSNLYCFNYEAYGTVNCDRVLTDFGVRHLHWGDGLYIDGKPVVLNGVSEQELAFGHDYALANTEIDHRTIQVPMLGFNAVCESQQPHNLRNGRNRNILGTLYGSQFSSHVWHDTPGFRRNFKSLLRQWVKERRNDASLVMWDIQHDSLLPSDFKAECYEIIREMDPSNRLIFDAESDRNVADCFPYQLYSDDDNGLFTTWGRPFSLAQDLAPDSLDDAVPGDLSAYLLKGVPGMTYLYRYNCGGDSLVDSWGQRWSSDTLTCCAKGETDGKVCIALAEREAQWLPEVDQPLVGTFCWGYQDMKFSFPVDSLQLYCIDLFLLEPWDMAPFARVFDIEVNGSLVDCSRDVASISGARNRLIRSTIRYSNMDQDHLEISFPKVASGQVVICAIAISRLGEM